MGATSLLSSYMTSISLDDPYEHAWTHFYSSAHENKALKTWSSGTSEYRKIKYHKLLTKEAVTRLKIIFKCFYGQQSFQAKMIVTETL